MKYYTRKKLLDVYNNGANINVYTYPCIIVKGVTHKLQFFIHHTLHAYIKQQAIMRINDI